ncbi:MAG: RlmE family RNA methyltransferase [Maricaulaceae bacterium]
MSEEDEPRRRRRRPADGGERAASGRGLTEKVKTARGRKLGSKLWLERQLNDPYVRKAKQAGYRSRAAFKLIELDDRFSVLRRGARVVDLGAAPGGWLQVALERGASHVVGVDLLPIDPVAGAQILEGDFTDAQTVDAVTQALAGPADVVLSDMAANASGHRATDHMRVVALVEAAADFAQDVLSPGGGFVAKVFQGGAEGALLERLKKQFKTVRHAKPPASRPESPETYLVAQGFRGR